MAIGTLLIRADASVDIGAGHLARCLALAEAWQRQGGKAVFLSHCPFPQLRQRMVRSGADLLPLEQVQGDAESLAGAIRRVRQLLPDPGAEPRPWLAIDGYHFEDACQPAARECGCRLLVIDDDARAARYEAELLLNQNLAAPQLSYSYVEGTTLLLGTRYVLLRSEFQPWRNWQRRTSAPARRVLITLGGSDPAGVTQRVLEAVASLRDWEFRVLVGPANPHAEALRRTAAAAGRIELLCGAADISEQMAWADVAISAAGSTCWELAYMQLPALLLVVAANQQSVAHALQVAGTAENLGRAEQVTPPAIAEALARLGADQPRRIAYAAAGRRLVDGGGAERVVAIMQALAGQFTPGEPQLRRVSPEDSLAIWRLANEPSVRHSSLSTYPILLDEHEQWFQERLDDPRVCMWVLEYQGLLLGNIRYLRLDADTAEISLAVAPAFRRRGLGTRLLQETRRPACRQLQVRRLQAVVREENLVSLQTFRKAGFRYVGPQLVADAPCHILEQSW